MSAPEAGAPFKPDLEEALARYEQGERNKQVVQALFEVIHGPVELLAALDGIVAEDYVQNNPYVPQGREGLRQFFTEILAKPVEERLDPSKTLRVQLVAEGDLVLRHEIRSDGLLFDLFRVEDGLLREHWDAFRTRPGETAVYGF